MKTIALLLAAACLATAADTPFYLHDGDRVVFYGDSITDQRLYTVITETYAVTRYPNLNLTFVHSGWGGDRVSGGGGGPIDVRLTRDVLSYKPTVMTIMLGMNDGSYRPETADNDHLFFAGYRHIVETVKSAMPNTRITAIEPSPYDDTTRDPNFPGGYNEVLISFSKWIADYAKEVNVNTADLNTGVVAMLRKADGISHEEAQKIIPDRVHPGFSGHLVMAEQLLKSWNARSAVSSVAIPASGNEPKAEHVQISDFRRAGKTLSWTAMEDALPLPFAQWQKTANNGPVDLVFRSSDVADALNQEKLVVRGLPSGVYSIKVDGESVTAANNEELADGINLAVLDTPMTRQAKDVYDLTVAHCDVHNTRWRTFQVPLEKYNVPQDSAALQAADALEQGILQQRRAAAQPKPHRFEIVPVL